ncbi:hypothetical protein AAS23_gp15 [Pantoea phage vB_PagS_AAS23]|uniref:Phage protein n=1 Tax=Pantoea phage vB_PagS_AAS23 TaxID=2499073 RepID=A0A3S9U7T1_9CAUD|nr:tail length tape measure protein [Pantoea phage vB_PagS_AAS23]AZS06328.1 hypothetical protein AAS23_gp15 [Pantoea phage vB_PagS_AAS23]
MSRDDYDSDDDNLEEVPFFSDMHDSWDLFLAMSTQWNYGPDGIPTGINYNSFHTVAKIYRIECEETAFNDLRIMEQQAINIIRNGKRP